MSALVHIDGHLFQDEYSGELAVPFTGASSPSVVFSSAPWISALDSNGGLKLASNTFFRNGTSDYYAGPLGQDGTIGADDCDQWDRIWGVRQSDIVAHLEDNEDGTIDSPLHSIYGWPGSGNSHFKEYNGFDLPERQGFGAPFADLNSNGIYEPHLGEYPHPEGVDHGVLVSEIAWYVYNDFGGLHVSSFGEPLGVDIQQTFYGFVCDSLDIINTTLYSAAKITNMSGGTLYDVIFSHWADPDLGCFSDDVQGSDTLSNTAFVYNEDNTDGTFGQFCPSSSGTINVYGDNPPVYATTFLSHDMSAFIATNGVPISNDPTGFPETPIGRRYAMQGLWQDGSPLYAAGNGYMQTTADTTSYHFFGNPTSPTDWSMMSIEDNSFDLRTVQSTRFGDLQPNQTETVVMAYSYHRGSELDHLGNVTLMYDQVSQLQSLYDSGMPLGCTRYISNCAEDCVYPGDANHDGVANGRDFLEVLSSIDSSGSVRDLPLAWEPQPAIDWLNTSPPGTNLKHVDANGDGLVSAHDLDLVDYHFWQTTENYAPGNIEFGDDIMVSLRDSIIFHGSSLFRTTPLFASNISLDSVIGFTFEMVYDTAYWIQTAFNGTCFLPGDSITRLSHEIPGRYSSTCFSLNRSISRIDPDEFTGGVMRMDWENIPEDIRDTTYLEIISANALMVDGSIVALSGNRYPVIIEPVVSSLRDLEKDDFKLFPNPSSGDLTIQSGDPVEDVRYQVSDLSGRILSTGFVAGNQINLDLASGTYIVEVLTEIPKKALVVISGR